MAFQLLYNYPVMGDLFSSLGARYQSYQSRICHNRGKEHIEGRVSARWGWVRLFWKPLAGLNALQGPSGAREQRMQFILCRTSVGLQCFLPFLEVTSSEVSNGFCCCGGKPYLCGLRTVWCHSLLLLLHQSQWWSLSFMWGANAESLGMALRGDLDWIPERWREQGYLRWKLGPGQHERGESKARGIHEMEGT